MPAHSLTRRSALLATAAAGVACAHPALAQLRVNVDRGRIEPVPIAVSPLAGQNLDEQRRGEEIAAVITADLEGSGLFRVIDPAAYIQAPDELREVPRYADWRQINAQALVAGAVGLTGAMEIEFRLFDVFAGEQLEGLRFTSAPDNWRQIAHRIADTVYARITGDAGYFDSRIAYVAQSGPATRRIKRVAMMDQDGANHRFVTDGDSLVLTPQWAPDAREIAYLAYRGQPQVLVRDLASGRDRLLVDTGGMTFSPRYAPDGQSLLFTRAENGNSDIYSLPIGGSAANRLTRDGGIDTSPSFSPEGDEIVFNSDRGGSPQLYIMGPDGGAPRRISFGEGRYGSPAWSPRGDFIAFTVVKGGLFHIGVMRPDGADERLLTRSFLDEGPSWSPNGRVIVFSRQDPTSDRTRLFTIDVTGYVERELPTPLDASDPDWSPLLA